MLFSLEWLVGCRFEVYRNLHASQQWNLYEKIFDRLHPLCRDLKPGHHLVLFLGARFPGWQNFTRRAYIRVRFGAPSLHS